MTNADVNAEDGACATPSFDWTELERTIHDVECMALTLEAMGCTDSELSPKAIYWVGLHLGDASASLKAQLAAYLSSRQA